MLMCAALNQYKPSLAQVRYTVLMSNFKSESMIESNSYPLLCHKTKQLMSLYFRAIAFKRL